MQIGTLTVTRKQLIGLVILVVLIIGLVVGMILVQTTQIFKPRATGTEPANAFQFTDSAGSPLPRTGNTINTQSQNIKIQLTDPAALTGQ